MVFPVPLTDPTTQLKLPGGFRFNPTDEELILLYLHPKVTGQDFQYLIVRDVELYKYDPWELPGMAIFGEEEWYFFTRRERKYPNGTRPNRVAKTGYWKATGTDKEIVSGNMRLGSKKTLVFYVGKVPTTCKTDWVMHEFRLPELTGKDINSSPFDEWVLCRIYNKSSSYKKIISGGLSIESSSSSSSSSPFDYVLNSLPATNEKFLNIPNTHSVNTHTKDDENIYIPKFDSECYDWTSVGAFPLWDPINNNRLNSTFVDQTFNGEVPSGIQTEIRENSGYLAAPGFFDQMDPFAIKYLSHQSGSGYGL